MTTARDVQIAILAAGFSVGKAGPDGVWGRDSIAGLKDYQRAKMLPVTGNRDALTMASLFPKGATALAPPWIEEARRLMGVREVAGKQHSSVIMGWAKRLKIWFPDDETAWCGLFVAHCIGATLPGEPLPANPLGAQQWVKLGQVIDTPALGAVLVFWRGSPSNWQGHVGFYVGERADAYRVLGGNQSNAVTETWIEKKRLVKNGIRWPKTAAPGTAGRIFLTAGGSLSHNEA